MYQNLLAEMKRNKVTSMMLAAELGFKSPNTLTYKLTGKTCFTLDEAKQIANKFGKPIEELFAIEKAQEKSRYCVDRRNDS